jgi:hypothetical protein
MHKNTLIENPKTNTNVYGLIPYINFRKNDEFSAGEIVLRYGEHRGPNKGFGVAHIWAEHASDLKKIGYHNIKDVAKFISDAITPRSPIYCEFNNMKGNNRIAVLKTSVGIVYLELKKDGHNKEFYSVVTAFPKGKARGTQIGSTR